MHLPTIDKQAMPICTGGNRCCVRVLNEFVRKSLFYGLTARHVGCIRHHVRDHGIGQACFPLVDFDLHFVPCILCGGLLSQLIGIKSAKEIGEAFVDHDKA